MTKHDNTSPEPDPLSGNMDIWNRLSPVDRKFTKKITGKSYQGDSPNPTYVIRKLTEVFGPIGGNWGFNVVNEKVIPGKPHKVLVEDTRTYSADGQTQIGGTMRYEIVREELHQVEILFWIKDALGQKGTFSCFGGTPMLYLAKNGNWIHDEDAAKKSLTDAFTKAASWLGACADIFLGLFDDKYTSQPKGDDGPEHGPGANPDPTAGEKLQTTPAKRTTTADAGGW